MSSEPRRSYLTIAAAIVIAGVLISVSLFAAVRTVATSTSYVTTMSISVSTLGTSAEGTQPTVTTTSTVTRTVTSVEASPLSLQVGLNASTIASGRALRATITIFNPLLSNFTATSTSQASSVISNWDQYDFICADNFVSVIGYAVLPGHYTALNVSSATPLDMVSPEAVVFCISAGGPASQILFLSNSSMMEYYNLQTKAFGGPSVHASLIPSTEPCNGNTSYFSCSPSGVLNGYFDSSVQNETQSFHYFPPGEYTIAAEDSWGQTDFAYFEVTF